MKKTLVAISVAAFLGTAGAALAEEAKGKIQAVDPAAKTITLEDGTTYTLAEGVMVRHATAWCRSNGFVRRERRNQDRIFGHAGPIDQAPSLRGGS